MPTVLRTNGSLSEDRVRDIRATPLVINALLRLVTMQKHMQPTIAVARFLSRQFQESLPQANIHGTLSRHNVRCQERTCLAFQLVCTWTRGCRNCHCSAVKLSSRSWVRTIFWKLLANTPTRRSLLKGGQFDVLVHKGLSAKSFNIGTHAWALPEILGIHGLDQVVWISDPELVPENFALLRGAC